MKRFAALLIGLVATACLAESTNERIPLPVSPLPTIDPPAVPMRRLSALQFGRSIRDVFGDDIFVPDQLEPDLPQAGLIAIGSSHASISPRGVEQYESAAYVVASQAVETEARRGVWAPCLDSEARRTECVEAALTRVGRRLWRRPLTEDETAALLVVVDTASEALGDTNHAIQFALAALLQSPNFLFRAEAGTDAYAFASRLSFFLWNAAPDEALLDAAQSGELSTPEGRQRHVERMLASPRTKEGVVNFFSELLELYRLENMVKDPTLYVHATPELADAAREETVLGLQKLIFDDDGDYRDLFTAETTFVDRRLAAIYGIKAGSPTGFAEARLSEENRRRGLLGQVSFLALHSHPGASSAVLRGAFVRTTLLCHEIPPPPADVSTALPEPSQFARTLRERVKIHLEAPSCSSCHLLMDPIGLGFENFDGIGGFRLTEAGAPIDPAGDLDGAAFSGPWDLAAAVGGHPDLPRCFVRTLYRYARGDVEGADERVLIDAFAERFAQRGFRVKSLLFDIATSPSFYGAQEARQ